jgi:oxysterol-binding protein-related protein 9/10/11
LQIIISLQSLATFKGDLASLTAPPFLLSPQSMIEFSTYWCETPSNFVAPALESDPEKRALLVLQWYLSTLKQQHNNRDENGKKKKMKPLNPFLGEIFKGEWRDEVGKTKMVAEQASHHPPITAFNMWNEEHGIRVTFSSSSRLCHY